MAARSQSTSSLMALPTEIRLIILRELLVRPPVWIPGTIVETAILLTCKNLYEEGSSVMYNENNVVINMQTHLTRARNNLLRVCFLNTPCTTNYGVSIGLSTTLLDGRRKPKIRSCSPEKLTGLAKFQKFKLSIDFSSLEEDRVALSQQAIVDLRPALDGKKLIIHFAMTPPELASAFPNINYTLWHTPALFQQLRCKSVEFHHPTMIPIQRPVLKSLKHLIISDEPAFDMLKILLRIQHYTRSDRELRGMDHYLHYDYDLVYQLHCRKQPYLDKIDGLVKLMRFAIRDSDQTRFLSMASKCKFWITYLFHENRLIRGRPATFTLRALEELGI